MPLDLLLLELKFSSVFATAVPVSGLVLVPQRSVGFSPHLSLVSPVLSTVTVFPSSLNFVSKWKDLPSHSSHMVHHCTKSFLNLKR